MAMSLGTTQTITRTISRKGWPTVGIRCVSAAAAVETNNTIPYIPNDTPPSIKTPPGRRQTIRKAKPFSDFLTDNYNRHHDYLRISVTERCNLRCLYCMPEEGIKLSPSRELLTSAEIYYLSALFVNQGVTKIRLTGGEPTVREDIVHLMQQIGSLRRNGLKELALTTNGISLHRKLDAMVEAGLTGVNISLDTLDSHQFQILTRRQGFDAVMKSINRVQEMNKLGAGVKLKINCVVMRDVNDHQILPFVDLTKDRDVEVRFIEYMPFGGNKWSQKKMLSYEEMLDMIRAKYPTVGRLRDAKNDTSKTWQIPGHKGRVGFITSMTHNFCGTCNRLRITGDGNLKVCLHGNAEVSLRDLLRTERNGEPMDEAAFEAIRQIELDRRKQDSTIGWITKERQLLDVIGTAVKRKAARHAGMENLENMENRPMILIGEPRSQAVPHYLRHAPWSSGLPLPWSNVPTHLLNSASSISRGARCYSSDSQDRSDKDRDPNEKEQRPSLVSSLGFQSLSGLFSPSPQGRYSRPPAESDVMSPTLAVKQDDVPADPEGIKRDDNADKIDLSFFNTSLFKAGEDGSQNASKARKASAKPGAMPNVAGTAPLSGSGQIHQPQSIFRRVVGPASISAPLKREELKTESQKAVNPFIPKMADESMSTGLGKSRLSARGQRTIGWEIRARNRAGSPQRDPTLVRRIWPAPSAFIAKPDNEGRTASFSPAAAPHAPNPFAAEGVLYRSVFKPNADVEKEQKPWGLDKTKPDTIETPVGHRATQTELITPLDQRQQQHQAAVESKSRVKCPSRQSGQPQTVSGRDNNGKSQLTHVSSSGEAHIVDIGSKTATKRVAIAYSSVRFSDLEPYNQICANDNKKGDVLAVAHIAGIMAAKRTSDLVPLCHPLAISKVEVECKLIPPNKTRRLGSRMPQGGVSVLAHVECIGPTGVEMEALTAAMTASLTVYDMCKAVDKDMRILQTCLVYKSGGRSGTFTDLAWLRLIGGINTTYFQERGLHRPDLEAMVNKARESKEEGPGNTEDNNGEVHRRGPWYLKRWQPRSDQIFAERDH
ncbi:molybdenum cofactor biosynthesis prote [Teratosphaeria nubilosa]|uniref:Molybdenum cofactor biosynthesis prote n=1 Tax=Teratosphaeria nubilosa TaxID=161662 RepID=A0A6G1L359_9PEZI|nr:molybdenum cofactor biosynthesis prote [Teratosphaeria nubilosa]